MTELDRIRSAGARTLPLLTALGIGLAPGCGGHGPACLDQDLDGYGEGCVDGPDCDDDNALRNEDCEAVPPPDCTADSLAVGCPCLVGATTGCYPGSEGTDGVGLCRAGRATCLHGHWGLCDGAVVPRGETCDARDQDCDGLVDNGVLSPCGACTPGCNGAVWGEADAPFEPGGGLDLGPLGELTLAWEEVVDAACVWVANSAEGTLSRIDALAAIETARYATGGVEPSRVAVDYAGDAWVANREFDGTSTLTKVGGQPDRCVDADGDGLETSTGPLDVLPFGADECVRLRVPVGEVGGLARALAIDGDRGLDGASGGNVWVGMHDGQEVLEVDGLTGEVRDRVPTPGFAPYAAAFDPWGVLWLASRDGYLARIDRRARPLEVERIEVPLACYLVYSLAVDRRGRLYLTGFSCDDVISYDPVTGVFRSQPSPPSPRGIGILGGEPWVAHTGGQLSRLDPERLQILGTLDLASDGFTPMESIGVGVDAFDRVWVASTSGGRAADDVGVATRFDPADGSLVHVPVGRAPHTQGDLTGAELVGGFLPEGAASRIFDGCPLEGETDWLRLHLTADAGATGTVEIAVRHAADRGALAAVPFTTLGRFPDDRPPFDLDAPDGGVLELRLTLSTSARDGAPRVRRVGIEWSCPGPM